MRASWITRPLLAILLLAVVLVIVSGVLELSSAVRLASSQAAVEAGLVAGTVQRELARRLAESPGDSLSALGADVRMRETLRDGLARAPSVVDVAVIGPGGKTVAHTQPALIGTVPAPHPPLPEIRSFGRSLEVLWSLWRKPVVYQVETDLRRGEEPYVTIRVAIAGSFLWEAVHQAASRGLAAAIIVICLAVIIGVLLGRLAVGRVRVLEAGIDAIRAGRFEQPLPESGVDEFARLARALNLLGAQYHEERQLHAEHSSAVLEESFPERARPPESAWGDHSRVLARLGQAATGVAHELRNQLQTVQFDLDELRKGDSMPPDLMRKRVESAAQGVQNLGGAVRGFLKVARVRPLAPEPVRVNDLLARIHAEMESEAVLAGIDLSLEADCTNPETMADPEVLRHAVHNLVRNSLQALTDREGKVTIRSSCDSARLRISVADNGPGIAPDVLDRVFDLYFTTRLDGTGVGLALVRQAAEMHGGDVTIDSTPGAGTVVTIEIPLRAPGDRDTMAKSGLAHADAGRGRMLLAGLLVLVALGGTGCAHILPWRKARPPAPIIIPGDAQAAEPVEPTGPPDSQTVAAPPATGGSAVRERERETTNPAKPPPVVPPVVAPVPAPVDSTQTDKTLSEDIPPAEKAALLQATQRDLDETAAILRTLGPAQVTGRGGEELRTIQALVKASREAGDRSEFREAASLAHKAWLLTMELSGR